MFVGRELVFLHLQKAAGTYVVDRLAAALPGEVRAGHDPLREDPGGRLVAATIRDPWDWYVSLWAYGCQRQGEVYGRLVETRGALVRRSLRAALTGRSGWGDSLLRIDLDRGRDAAAWRELYRSPDDPESFRAWLHRIMTMPGRGHLPDTYPLLPLGEHVGFMSFRVLRLFTRWRTWLEQSHRISTADEALDHYRRHCIVDHVLRAERIEHDLERLLRRLGVAGPRPAPARTNASRRLPAAACYDRRSADLVRQRERMIVELFGYAPPEPGA